MSVNRITRAHECFREAQVAPVHQSFRIIATAHEQDVARPWLLSEIVPMFHFHHITPLSAQEQVRYVVAVGVLAVLSVEG